jgi:sulfur-oxidizing protein SoxX
MAGRWRWRGGAATALVFAALLPAVAPPAIAGDGIAAPLPGAAPGDAARGRAIVANRQLSLCLLCHTGPIPEERFQGNLAPDLQGAGQRWTAAQLRLRIVDASYFYPATIMPAYYKTEGLTRVATSYKDKTILTAQQIEDVIAWLQTLKEPAQ